MISYIAWRTNAKRTKILEQNSATGTAVGFHGKKSKVGNLAFGFAMGHLVGKRFVKTLERRTW